VSALSYFSDAKLEENSVVWTAVIPKLAAFVILICRTQLSSDVSLLEYSKGDIFFCRFHSREDNSENGPQIGARFMCDPLKLDDPRVQHLMLLIW
jgi:hypothetical protein